MTGIVGRNFGSFNKLCGEMVGTLKNVVLVTNMWGIVRREIGEAREKGLPSNIFKLALDKGAQMVRHHDTVQSAHDIIRMITKNHPVVRQELMDKRKDIINTTAAINRELDNEQMRRHQTEPRENREKVERVLKGKDEEMEHEAKGSEVATIIPRVVRPQSHSYRSFYQYSLFPLFFLNSDAPACRRLIERVFAPGELPSLIEAAFSSKDETDMIRRLRGNDAQTFIDVIDEACHPPTRHREIQFIEGTFH